MTWMPPSIPEEEKVIKCQKMMDDDVPPFWELLEGILPEAGWITGDKLTWIDIAFGTFLYSGPLNPASKRAALWAPAWEKAGPILKGYAARFGEEFKDYLESRPPAPL